MNIEDKMKELPPCVDMEIYRKFEKVLSMLVKRKIGITNVIDFTNEEIRQALKAQKESEADKWEKTVQFYVKEAEKKQKEEIEKLVEEFRSPNIGKLKTTDCHNQAIKDILKAIKEI